MRSQDAARLLLLSALWGGSFIFMRVAAPSLGAIVTAEARVVIAGLLLIGYAAATRQDLGLRERWRQYFFVGLINSAVPFALICWAEIRVSASLAAILNATSPLFGAAIAAVWLKEPITVRKVAGIFVALAGVATAGATDGAALLGAAMALPAEVLAVGPLHAATSIVADVAKASRSR